MQKWGEFISNFHVALVLHFCISGQDSCIVNLLRSPCGAHCGCHRWVLWADWPLRACFWKVKGLERNERAEMSALLLQWSAYHRGCRRSPVKYWSVWQQWLHGVLLPHTKHWVAFMCVGVRRGGRPGCSLNVRRLCCRGERNLSGKR